MVNKIRLYIDEDASRNSFVIALRNANIDTLTTFEAGNLGLIDLEQLIKGFTEVSFIYISKANKK